MSLQHEIDMQEEQVRILGTGTLSMPEMVASVDQVAADPRFRSHFTVILDLRQANYTAELDDGDTFAAALKRKQRDFQNKFALVVPEPLHILARLYCALASVGGISRMKCFTDMEKARFWCRTPL